MKHTMSDLAKFFRTQRNFPSILFFGTGKNQIAGEGQSGGRYVVEHVKAAERHYVNKYGAEEYQRRMDKLVHPEKYR